MPEIVGIRREDACSCLSGNDDHMRIHDVGSTERPRVPPYPANQAVVVSPAGRQHAQGPHRPPRPVERARQQPLAVSSSPPFSPLLSPFCAQALVTTACEQDAVRSGRDDRDGMGPTMNAHKAWESTSRYAAPVLTSTASPGPWEALMGYPYKSVRVSDYRRGPTPLRSGSHDGRRRAWQPGAP